MSGEKLSSQTSQNVHDELGDDSQPPFRLSDEVQAIAGKLGEDVLGSEFMRSIRDSDITTVKVYASFLPNVTTSYSLGTIERLIDAGFDTAKGFIEYQKQQIELHSRIVREVNDYLGI